MEKVSAVRQTSEVGASAAPPLPPTHIHIHTQFIYPHIIQYSMSEFPDPDYKHFSICKKCENGTACQHQATV